MTTKPTPTRKPTGRKAERPPKRWRALKAGDVRPKGYQWRDEYGRWHPGEHPGRVHQSWQQPCRAPVTGKAKGRRK